jgi:hypothetical protein
MKALHQRLRWKDEKLSEHRKTLQKLREEFLKFERTMEELYLLKLLAEDLKSFRKMITLKKYD